MKYTKRGLLRAGAFAAVAGAAIAAVAYVRAEEPPPPKYNVLWIVADCLSANARFETTSIDGITQPVMPNLNAIAAEGVEFTNSWSSSDWTGAAAAGMLFSVYPTPAGNYSYVPGMNENFLYNLKKMKAGLNSSPFKRSAYVTNFTLLDPAFAALFDDTTNLIGVDYYGGTPDAYFELMHNRAAAVFREWEGQWGSRTEEERDRNRIDLLWLMDCHEPTCPPRELRATFPDKRAGERGYDLAKIRRRVSAGEKSADLENLLFDLKTDYLTSAYYADREIGDLYRYLKETGFFDNGMLIITADHGQSWGEPHLTPSMLHCTTMYPEETNVPLLIVGKDPTTKKPFTRGLKIDTQISTTDILPTIAECYEFGANHMVGKSLLPLMHGKETADREIYACRGGDDNKRLLITPDRFALILTTSPDDKKTTLIEGYNLKSDRGMTRPLSPADYKPLFDKGLSRMSEIMKGYKPGPETATPEATNDIEQQGLRDLGYLN